MDSGAGDKLIPRCMVNATRIRPSAGSRCGLRYVAATGEKIDNEGEVDLHFITSKGFSESWPFQVANVNKSLGSVADRVDNKCRVVYDQDDDGKDLRYILDKLSGRIMKMRRTGKVWNAVVAKDMISPDLFSRQG